MASAPGETGPKARPIRTVDDLVGVYYEAIKAPNERRIGAEAEKFGVDAKTGAPLPYRGERSVLRVLETLVERHGWYPDYERPGGPLIALLRAGASITLEPGGQLELSGAPLDTIHQICFEMSGHMAELRDISKELDIVWLGVGFHPFARQEDLDWVPKARYGVMKRYLPTRGAHGLDMMRRTATVQANFDYTSEADAMRKLRLSLRLSPFVTAMFANSPFYEGRIFGGKSFRAQAWLSVDPSRQGLVKRVLDGGDRFLDYVEWALHAPMFLFKHGDRYFENTGQSFHSFWKHGFQGERPTVGDWETHLNTMFPEVRLKRTLEVRGADSLPAYLTCALPALWTGLLYDEKACAGAEALVDGVGHDELEALRPAIAQQALGASFRGKPVADLAMQLVELASGGLERRGRLNRNGNDEREHLAGLRALIEKGQSPADALLAAVEDPSGDLVSQILTRARM